MVAWQTCTLSSQYMCCVCVSVSLTDYFTWLWSRHLVESVDSDLYFPKFSFSRHFLTNKANLPPSKYWYMCIFMFKLHLFLVPTTVHQTQCMSHELNQFSAHTCSIAFHSIHVGHMGVLNHNGKKRKHCTAWCLLVKSKLSSDTLSWKLHAVLCNVPCLACIGAAIISFTCLPDLIRGGYISV